MIIEVFPKQAFMAEAHYFPFYNALLAEKTLQESKVQDTCTQFDITGVPIEELMVYFICEVGSLLCPTSGAGPKRSAFLRELLAVLQTICWMVNGTLRNEGCDRTCLSVRDFVYRVDEYLEERFPEYMSQILM